MKTGQRRDGAPSVNPPSPPGGNLVNPKTPDETKKPNEGDQINIENLPDLEPTISYVELLEVHFKKGVVIFSEERAKRTIKLDEEAKTGPLNITVPVKIFYSRDVKGQIQRSTTAGEVHKMFQLLADAWAEWIDKRK